MTTTAHMLGHGNCPACNEEGFREAQAMHRLRATNAKLLEALESSAGKLHDLRGDPDCKAHVFRECPKYYCKDARAVIEEAKERPR